MQKTLEISWDEAAEIWECSPRHARTIAAQFSKQVRPVRYSHKRVRIPITQVFAVRREMRRRAVAAAQGGAR